MLKSYSLGISRLCFWLVAVTLGAAQCWTSKHEILSDGISYLEIAAAYRAGHWDQAINAYWSPLYSWLIAALLGLLHPSPYWEVAADHLALFIAYLAGLFGFEFLLRELVLALRSPEPQARALPEVTLYIAGYCAMLFAAIALVGLTYCSPDMIALALLITLSAMLLRAQRTGGSSWLWIGIGMVSASFYLARTAFLPLFLVYLCAIAWLLHRRGENVIRPMVMVVLAFGMFAGPFIVAISLKTASFTIGESGRLNYGWEIAGASRLIHWQGEPFDIGRPAHPTTLAVAKPKTFVFTRATEASYSPWYEPAYWYQGIKPKVKLANQIRVVAVNASLTILYLVRSPIFLPCVLVGCLVGLRRWWAGLGPVWIIVLPPVLGIGLYCLVYFEKRYVAGNFLIVWLAVLASLRFRSDDLRRWGSRIVIGCALLFTGVYGIYKQLPVVKYTLSDLIHRREKEGNVQYAIASDLLGLGLKPGDKVAYIGPAINADWARIARLQIVAEVPLLYGRNQRLLNNLLIDDTSQIKAFCSADSATQNRVFQAFRSAGARMVVEDGFFEKDSCQSWSLVLSSKQLQRLPKYDPNGFSQLRTRYYPLFRDGGQETQD